MLPSAQEYLNEGGLDPSAAAWVTIGCFLGGVIGIQVFSGLLHRFIPSHVVDCDHSHEDKEGDDESSLETIAGSSHAYKSDDLTTESTPLISHSEPDLKGPSNSQPRMAVIEGSQRLDAPYTTAPSTRRPTLQDRLTTRVSTFVAGVKHICDESGPCYGYTEPCGNQCLKSVSKSPTRVSTRNFGRSSNAGPPLQHSLLRAATTFRGRPKNLRRRTYDEETPNISPSATFFEHSTPCGDSHDHDNSPSREDLRNGRSSTRYVLEDELTNGHATSHWHISAASGAISGGETVHHHHVPENAFLAIGLQTSIAIALHKLPEGFITYATNHANSKLGFAVFMALFIHNITEGFAMALPLYLAIGSRWKAMFWSSLLGGVSQPMGAGVAALWFHLAGRGDMAPGDTVYGCMFSITSGIMASVALQLFSESLSLTHNRNICTTFAFIGMGFLGASHALTAL